MREKKPIPTVDITDRIPLIPKRTGQTWYQELRRRQYDPLLGSTTCMMIPCDVTTSEIKPRYLGTFTP